MENCEKHIIRDAEQNCIWSFPADSCPYCRADALEKLLDEARTVIEGELALTQRIAERCAVLADGYIGCDCLAADIRKEFI